MTSVRPEPATHLETLEALIRDRFTEYKIPPGHTPTITTVEALPEHLDELARQARVNIPTVYIQGQ